MGSSPTQLLTFDLPFGVSEFTVVRGAATSTDVNFVASSFTGLDVIAQPLDTNETNITIIVAAIVILGSLFYISSATGKSLDQCHSGQDCFYSRYAACSASPVGWWAGTPYESLW
jgi:hypothetical protein